MYINIGIQRELLVAILIIPPGSSTGNIYDILSAMAYIKYMLHTTFKRRYRGEFFKILLVFASIVSVFLGSINEIFFPPF